ncbi:MAG TPA: M28 family metallopeptidase [Candidatus Acidoferrum sp.]|nr:M28 family metallopeptidase [Candidatus Acidoferrum sp.]
MSKLVKYLVCPALVFALALPASVVQASTDPSDAAMESIRPEAIRAHMNFLADDLIEGRGAISRGYEISARYMATEFESMGLSPAGDAGTYLQNVPLRSIRPDEANTTVSVIRKGKTETLVFRKDFLAPGDPARKESSVEAPVIYVGFGVTAPEQNYDDYKGIDAKGKIVAMVSEAPNFESSLKAHYSSFEVKIANAAAHGAIGLIVVDDPVLEGLYSFKEQVRDLSRPGLRWLTKEGAPNDYFPQIRGGAILSLEASKQLFVGSGHTAAEVFQAAKEGKPLTFALPLSVKIHTQTKLEDVSSHNVVARLEGSDPALKNEYLVYSAHLDHLGIGEAVKGDTIYNGALDNASGCAILLEVARAFAQMNPRPKRSILFVAVTGEEAGLLGSDYFAHFPTVSKDSIVANVNMDEDQMLWPLQDIIPFGAEHSTLDGVVKRAAERLHLAISPDPMPEEVIFIRSDQYSFVKQGIPAVFPTPGFKSNDPKIDPLAIFKEWEETRYHQPQDDMQQPNLDFNQAVKYAQFAYLCGWLITQDPARPAWNAHDFFGDHYSKKM